MDTTHSILTTKQDSMSRVNIIISDPTKSISMTSVQVVPLKTKKKRSKFSRAYFYKKTASGVIQ